jgi:hypothetical protein
VTLSRHLRESSSLVRLLLNRFSIRFYPPIGCRKLAGIRP